ncbi:MAG: hypothetical protein PUJ82_06510 [Spirochaetales bacterium]|nr:hypothetical protein [Spirochaetales bacterium]MDY5913760.1 hypothetical protein [Treponema sp.]
MNRRIKKRQAQKLCMYICMNAYLASFNDIDFYAFNVPPLVSDFLKTVPVLSVLSKKNIEKQFCKGLRDFYHVCSKMTIWEYKLPLLKAAKLTDSLFALILEMFRLRLTVLKDCNDGLFTDEDRNCILNLSNELELSETEIAKRIGFIEENLKMANSSNS